MAKKIEENKVINEKDLKEIKLDILDYVKSRIDIEIENSFKKIEKKIVKRKNIKIIKRDITIVLLLVLVCFMSYELYNTGYFNKYLAKNVTVSNDTQKEETNIEEQKVVKEDLLKKHKKALDNIVLNYNSKYLKDYYNGNLINELKLELTLATIPTDEMETDEETLIINSATMEKYYNQLFDSTYKAISFNYGSNKIKYLKNQEVYLASKDITKNNNKIKRFITNVDEVGNEVTISVIEYIVDNDKIINILSNEEVANSDEDILKIKDNLNKLEYHLTIKDDTYILKNIKKII